MGNPIMRSEWQAFENGSSLFSRYPLVAESSVKEIVSGAAMGLYPETIVVSPALTRTDDQAGEKRMVSMARVGNHG
jgi:hypothetical protein